MAWSLWPSYAGLLSRETRSMGLTLSGLSQHCGVHVTAGMHTSFHVATVLRILMEESMSYLLSLSVAPGSSVTKDFDPPLDMGIQAKVDFGESLTPAELAIWSEPRVLRAGERRRKPGPPAIMGWFGGPFLVCEAVKENWNCLGQETVASSHSRPGVWMNGVESVITARTTGSCRRAWMRLSSRQLVFPRAWAERGMSAAAETYP